MANHTGSEGVVKVAGSTIAELRNWSISEVADMLEDTSMGDTAKTFKSSLTSGTGSLDCWWDETDTNGQEAMTVGASVALVLYPEGDTGGDVTITVTALISERSISAAHDGIVEGTFAFQCTGAITYSTV